MSASAEVIARWSLLHHTHVPCIVTAHDRLVVAVSRVFIPSSDFNALGPEILYSTKTEASWYELKIFPVDPPFTFQDSGGGRRRGGGADEAGFYLYERDCKKHVYFF